MSERERWRFGPPELASDDGIEDDAAALAAAVAMGRELDDLARQPSVRPSQGFLDRTLGLVAAEPLPAPLFAARQAIRLRSLRGLLRALGDAGRVSAGGGRPARVRGQAFALVTAALLLVVSMVVVAAAGAVTVFAPVRPQTTTTAPTVSPSPSFPVSPSPTASPSGSLEPQPSPSGQDGCAADDSQTCGPNETAEPSGSQDQNDDGEANQSGEP
jgi:hypothetical protein